MKTTKIWMLAILFLAIFTVSCDKEEAVNEAKVLVEYLESTDGGNYANTAMPAIVKADGVKALMATGDVHIIDIRKSDDFTAGHIEDAVNVAAGDVISHLEGMDAASYEKIVIVCYTGQTAGWATCLARISGFDNVYSMKWGMCSWNDDFAGPWKSNALNTYATQFINTNYPKGAKGDLPSLKTGKTAAKDILAAQVDDVLGEGFGAAAITAAEVYANLENFYIVNYWKPEHYSDPGHIEGAMQYTPKETMSLATDLTTLPTDKTIVVYCYSGQNSANLVAYLRVLGYNAKSLKFGANTMIHDSLPAAKWSEDEIFGYGYISPL